MTDLPAPLIDSGIDLRGMPWMRLDVIRLMDSDLFALSTGDEFKAAVALWCKSWHQSPAGSLPSDDRVLAHLSGSGPKWKKVKAMALRGWVKCSDGRLYHKIIVEQALLAWKEKQQFDDRRAKDAKRLQDWREKRSGERSGNANETNLKHVSQPLRNALETDSRSNSNSTRRDDTIRDGTVLIKTPIGEGGVNNPTPKTALPPNFGISDEVEKWAKTKGYSADLPAYLEAFTLKVQANDYTKANWDAAFKTSMLDDWGKIRDKRNSSGNGKTARQLIEEAEANRANG